MVKIWVVAAAADKHRSVPRVNWWPAAFALVGLGALYALVSARLTLGPPWALLVLAVVAVGGTRVLGSRGMMLARRWLATLALAGVTIAVTVSAVALITSLLNKSTEAGDLLRDAVLLWVTNVLTFSLWYWELDGGGPANRHATGCGSTDFAFPQRVLGGELEATWLPEYVDYLFLAFNTSTAFSPTDTMVLARRAKVLMMYQSLVSLTTIAVLAARAINTI
jgi:hypothetical protein